MPRARLDPVRLVTTFRPSPSSMATSILVVVVLPLVPVTTITPRRTGATRRSMRRGSIFSATRPGSAEPPRPSRRLRRPARRPRAQANTEAKHAGTLPPGALAAGASPDTVRHADR